MGHVGIRYEEMQIREGYIGLGTIGEDRMG